MASTSISLSLSAACSVQGAYLSMCNVWFSCTGGFNSHSHIKQGVVINSPPLTDCFDFLSHWRNVKSLSLFYRYFHTDCPSKLANCTSPPIHHPHCTKLSIMSPYYGHLSDARVDQHLYSFIPYTGKLWNSLTMSIFPPSCDLNFLKRSIETSLIPIWTFTPCLYFSYCPLYRQVFFSMFVCPIPVPF